jgi:hypothetical protein
MGSGTRPHEYNLLGALTDRCRKRRSHRPIVHSPHSGDDLACYTHLQQPGFEADCDPFSLDRRATP